MQRDITTTQNQLNISINDAATIITKDYLGKLERYEIIAPSLEDTDIDIAECGKFYKLTKLVLNKDENFLNKLTTIVNVASSIGSSITTIIDSDGYKIDYYIGIVEKNIRGDREADKLRRQADASAFQGALQGNLVGSNLEELSDKEVAKLRDTKLIRENACYSSISGIVALRDESDKDIEGYVQGIENLVDSLKGQKYTLVMLADPLATSDMQTIKQGYEVLHTELSTLHKRLVTINESDTKSISNSTTEAITEGISKGITLTQSMTMSKGRAVGFNASLGVNLGITANVGINRSRFNSEASQRGESRQNTESRQSTRGTGFQSSTGTTHGKSLQLTYENRTIKSLLDKADSYLKRFDECESFGTFECAAYVVADNKETALTVAANYNALMRGEKSSIQSSHINSWYKERDTKYLSEYIGSLVHPRFKTSRTNGIVVNPASIISGSELAIQMGLPKKSVAGITVLPMAAFGRNVADDKSENTICLGSLYHMGNEEGNGKLVQQVKLDVESLAMHTFITGSTGKGKSTTIYSILDNLIEHKVKGSNDNIKFMVIEPAKGEYKNRFGGYDNVNVYGTNYKKSPLLRINPFSFPEDVHVLEHIDRLIEIFNVCWPMYAAMPAVLKDAIERAYVVAGWNLETSECKYQDNEGILLYPSFKDVLNQINIVVNSSEYSADSKGDYKGALCTRVKSLTNGLYSQIFTSNEIEANKLFDENVIIDLSRIGSSETKSFIMGLLIIKLQEYRMSNAKSSNESLKHITVLEEAHNILKGTSSMQVSEGSSIEAKSVELLANSIAEMRTYGEGFIIADQSPGLMDRSVIRNTNTKIIMGLPDMADRELVGKSANLNDEQIVELSRLNTFVAAVYQNNWLEPVLCKVDTAFKDVSSYNYILEDKEADDRFKVLEFMLMPATQIKHFNPQCIQDIKRIVFKLPIITEAKVAFMKYLNASTKQEIQRYRAEVIYSIFNAEKVMEAAKLELRKSKEQGIGNSYEYILEALEPSIDMLTYKNKHKIIAILARQYTQLDNTAEAKEVFKRVMNLI